MSDARHAHSRPGETSPGKRRFADRARGFAKRAERRVAERFLPVLWLIAFGAAILMTVTGGFDTDRIALPGRTLFWFVLIGWNTLKWQLWFAWRVRGHRDWIPAALIGTVVLNLPMPIEVGLALRLVGKAEAAPDIWGTWARAVAIALGIAATVAIALGIAATMAIAGWRIAREHRRRAAIAPPADGLLIRARVAPDALLAIEAEDHYCRVRRRDGHSELRHYRFGDALAEVVALDGEQVHRGAWVAAAGVTGAVRDGRRWLLVLSDGHRIPVSATHLPRARSRGWLAPPPAPERSGVAFPGASA